jgi:3-hydroxyisobutyrate dehydrogenase-like beta-hydroxyacid dehydrogenase
MSTEQLNKSTTIGWIGLGQMGVAHVTNLLKQGFNVTCWNRTAEKCSGVCALGAVSVSTPAEVIKASTVTFVMLSNADATRSVYTLPNEGILAAVSQGKYICECATIDADTVHELANQVRERNGAFLASPVAGHSKMAVDATCQFLCSGDRALFDMVKPALLVMSKNAVFLSEDERAASQAKIIINGLLAKITASIAEGLSQVRHAGLDSDSFLQLLQGHAMFSPLLGLCSKFMLDGTHPPLFQLKHMEKDARLASELSQNLGAGRHHLTHAAATTYKEATTDGSWNGDNWTAIFEYIEAKNEEN